MTFQEDLGLRISEARLRSGLSQKSLGQHLGLPRPSITKIEGGTQHLTAEGLAKLCRVLDVRPEQLLFGEDELGKAEAENARLREALGYRDVATGDPRLDKIYRLVFFLGMAQGETVQLLDMTQPGSNAATILEFIRSNVEDQSYGLAHVLAKQHQEGAYAWGEQQTSEDLDDVSREISDVGRALQRGEYGP